MVEVSNNTLTAVTGLRTTVSSPPLPSRTSLYDSFPIIRDMRDKHHYVTPNKSASAILNSVTPNHDEIFSLVAQDHTSLCDVIRMILVDKDRLNKILSITSLKRLTKPELHSLVGLFGFYPIRGGDALMRQPADLSETPFEIVPAIETEDRVVVVNKEDRRNNCFVVRNIYFENLAVFPTLNEAEVFYHIQR